MSLVGELQSLLDNQREHQEVFSSFNQYISILTWQYLVKKLCVPMLIKERVASFLVPSG